MAERAEDNDEPKKFYCRQRIVLAVMGFNCIMTAYILRQCLGVTLTKMNDKEDLFNWNEFQQGNILSAFFFGYVITHLPGAILCEKFGGKIILIIAMLVCSISSIITPLVTLYGGYIALCATRVIQGLGQGVVYPGLSFLLSKWIPKKERGRYGAFVYGGGQFGSIFANIACGFILNYMSWQSSFYFSGILSIIWVVMFFFLCSNDPNSHPYINKIEKDYLLAEMGTLEMNKNLPTTPWKYIFQSLPVWSLIIGQMGYDWGFYIMATDLPKYFSDVLNLSIVDNGIYNALPFLLMWIVSIFAGILADIMFIKNIMNLTNIRKFFTIISFMIPCFFMVAAGYATNKYIIVIYFTICLGIMGSYYGGIKLNSLDFSPNYAPTLMALANGFGAIMGFVVPNIIGVIVKNATREEWQIVFWLTMAVRGFCSIIYGIWGSGEIQPWNEPDNMQNYLEQKQMEKQKKRLIVNVNIFQYDS
ncbi:putative inorganic phosphate cotransporter [Condylostylus longicornis]|uniref:putative inorganic phosphate cotransporter n=1 Tax=Condylostylus longicornis TaxID=2530218 RepID=UPI00244E5063|nr:putative inorganic phosphate cotransporter [Condylostylus longicornis]